MGLPQAKDPKPRNVEIQVLGCLTMDQQCCELNASLALHPVVSWDAIRMVHAQLPSRGPIHAVAAQGHVAETAAGAVLAHVHARSPAETLLTMPQLVARLSEAALVHDGIQSLKLAPVPRLDPLCTFIADRTLTISC